MTERADPASDPGHAREWRRICRSFRYFLDHYVYVADGGGAKMTPWPWQRDLAKRLPWIRRLVVLKGRQLGMSWIAAAYALWVALTQRGALVLLLSQTKDDAVELLDKVQFVYENLPVWLRHSDAKLRTQLLKLPAMRSAVVALPSTKRAGRGRTAKLVIADEHATHTWAVDNFAAVSPTIDAGGQFLSISTANGVGNLYADLCSQASHGLPWVLPAIQPDGHFAFGTRLRDGLRDLREDGWLPLFIPYSARPGRDEAWWERKKASYPRQWMIHQEYPRDPEEAFVQTGRPRFDKEYLNRHKQLCRPPLPRSQWPEALRSWSEQELRLFDLPKPGHRYAAGADVAEGLEHGDYSDLCVLDADAGERPTEVLSLHGHWEPDEFGRLIFELSRLYPGRYGIERNNHGLTTIVAARKLGIKGLHYERAVLANSGQEIEPQKPGWLTNAVTKPLMIDELELGLRTFAVQLTDELAVPELTFYQVLKDGSTGAPSGKWDDRVISRAIAVQMLKHLPPKPTPPAPGPVHVAPILSGGLGMRL